MPRFSIVMPTRNRAQLLSFALQSALNQTYDDYEIVVSDNDSSDETADVARQCANKRVRYFRTDRCLSMPDSWEFALSKATGEWITFLGDDDAISSRLLASVADIIATSASHLVGWPRASYYHNNWEDARWRNRLIILRHTGQVIYYHGQEQLGRLFALGRLWGFPRMLDSCCHRELVSKVMGHVGRFFLAPYPDFTCCALMLSQVENYPYLDVPLALSGEAPQGTGRSTASTLAFVEEFRGEDLFKCVNLKSLLMANGIAESLLRAKEAVPMHLSQIQLNWEKYYADCYSEILGWTPTGCFPTNGDKDQLLALLRKESVKFQARVYMQAMENGLREWLRKLVFDSPVLTSLAYLAMGRHLVRGEDAGFRNSLEAVQYLDNFTARVVRPAIPSAQ